MSRRPWRWRIARVVVGLSALLVPRTRRPEWREEWTGELEALDRAGPGPALPHPLTFALGAPAHAIWARTEEWTMDGIWRDLRFAIRTLSRAPGFTLVAALTLALGIGANGAIFSLVDGLLFRPPGGIREPGRLVQIARSYDQDPRWDNWSWPAMKLIEDESRTLSGIAGYQTQAFILGTGPEAEAVAGQLVSGDYFRVLGVRPFLGRLLLPSDNVTPGGHPVAVLSHALWTRRFGADPTVVDRTVQLGSDPYQVVGVAPPDFSGPETLGRPPALWVPAMQHPPFREMLPFERWGWSWIEVVGRLADGVTVEEARASMDVVTARLREAASVNEDVRVLLAAGIGLDPEGRREARRVSALLVGVVALVLLLACTNVANLFLARTNARRTEVGIRLALGGGRRRVARQLLTESLVVAGLGTLLAVPVVRGAVELLPALLPYPLAVSLGADLRVYIFLVGAGALAGILFGALPAWAAGGRDVAASLGEAGTGRREGGTRGRDALVVAQLGISLTLVASAALLGRSLLNARASEPGFRPAGLRVAFMDLEPTGRYDPVSGRALIRRLLDDAGDLPGTRGVTAASQAPIVGAHARATVQPAERPDSEGYEAEHIVVGPGYFETLGIPLLQGRALGGLDEEPEPVVVVNQALARMFWPGEDAVGKRLAGDPGWRVVGVAGDVKMRSLRSEPRPAVYYPLSQSWSGRLALHVRADAPLAELSRSLRATVASHDPSLPVLAVFDMRDALAASMGETRTLGYLTGVFAALALVLATVGLYGLVSFGVSRRTREMGIRKALGADPRSLVSLVLRRGVGLASLGVAGGVGLSLLTGRFLEQLLFGVTPGSPTTLAAAGLTLFGAALLAAWIPARRASRVDAVVSLRE